jgi:hypothetical protein
MIGKIMRKITVSLLLVVAIFFFSTSGSSAFTKRYDLKIELAENLLQQIQTYDNQTNIITLGPISPFFNITQIILINGSSSEIQKIEKILNHRILHFILPLTYIECKDLDFSITYSKNVPFFIPFIRHISYFTSLFEGVEFPFNNETIWGKKHTILVEGFEGYFGFQRLRPWKISPAIFSFAGSYQEIAIIR